MEPSLFGGTAQGLTWDGQHLILAGTNYVASTMREGTNYVVRNPIPTCNAPPA